MRVLAKFGLFGFVGLAAIGSGEAAATIPVTISPATITRMNRTGHLLEPGTPWPECPAGVSIQFTLTAATPATVTYYWLVDRGDGPHRTSLQRFAFDAPGTHPLKFGFMLGPGGGTPDGLRHGMQRLARKLQLVVTVDEETIRSEEVNAIVECRRP